MMKYAIDVEYMMQLCIEYMLVSFNLAVRTLSI